VRLVPQNAIDVTGCGTRPTLFPPQVADSLERRALDYVINRAIPNGVFDRSDTMATVLFQFSRKLKMSRFTIDVLMERLTNLRPPRQRAADEWEGFVGRTYESLKACDELHNELGEQFDIVQARNAGFPSLIDRFEDLHRRISESIATLNSFENGTARTN